MDDAISTTMAIVRSSNDQQHPTSTTTTTTTTTAGAGRCRLSLRLSIHESPFKRRRRKPNRNRNNGSGRPSAAAASAVVVLFFVACWVFAPPNNVAVDALLPVHRDRRCRSSSSITTAAAAAAPSPSSSSSLPQHPTHFGGGTTTTADAARRATQPPFLPGSVASSAAHRCDATTATTGVTVSSSAAGAATTATTSTTAIAVPAAGPAEDGLNVVEAWCKVHMDVWYGNAMSIRCPFFRRRTADLLDGADMVMRFLVVRHKSLPLMGPPPGWRAATGNINGNGSRRHPALAPPKRKGLPIDVLAETIRRDWGVGTDWNQQDRLPRHKGYYITGRLDSTVYRDDCWFEGPDPDMPVRGLRKYLNAASQLFDTKASTAELLTLNVVEDDVGDGSPSSGGGSTIVATWRLQGVLHLPWRPSLPVWTGRTVYHLDDDHLIYRHEEYWDISVLQAFTQTLFPQLGNRIWKG